MKKTVSVIFVVLMAVAMLATYAAPAQAAKVNTIPFTHTVYYTSYVPGNTWFIDNNKIRISSGAVSESMSLDQTLFSKDVQVISIFNFVTGKGISVGKFTDTYVGNSYIGTGVMKGMSQGETTDPAGMTGTANLVASGSSDLYSHIIEKSTVSWHPYIMQTPNGPIPTLELTITGRYIVTP